MHMRTLIADIVNHEGKEVELMGWVTVRRDHGKLIFIDLRDRSGVCQVVFYGKEMYAVADKLRPEWVVRITGTVNKRPENMINANIPTGKHEIGAAKLEILGEAQTPPISIDTDGLEIGEENRMKYRYVDLRRARMQKNLRMRSKTLAFVDEYFKKNDL